MKKMVQRRVCAYDVKYADKASEWVNEIQKLISEYGDGQIEIEEDYDGGYEINFYYQDEETDEEYSLRTEQEEKAKNRQDWHDRREWQRLKAKFGE